MEEVSMMRKEVSSSLLLMLFGIYFTVESYRFGLGTWARPGPGYFPFGAGLIFSIISLSILVGSLRKVERNAAPPEPAGVFQWQNIVLVVVGMLAFAVRYGAWKDVAKEPLQVVSVATAILHMPPPAAFQRSAEGDNMPPAVVAHLAFTAPHCL